MARFKETNNRQGQFIPVIFDEQILPGTIEHAICDIIDHHLDLSVCDSRYKNDANGAPAVPPAILLKIILVCYAKGIFTSRRMEQAVKTIESFLASHEPKKGSRGREVKRNVTDNESAKMKSSHGMIQGYNGMAVVDEKTQVIVAAEAYGQGQEHDLLAPMVEQAESNLKETLKRETMAGAVVIADTQTQNIFRTNDGEGRHAQRGRYLFATHGYR